MRQSIRHGGILKCDAEGCGVQFISYSFVSLIRAQAKLAKWRRPLSKHVRWSADPVVEANRRVDLCPDHSSWIIPPEEYKAERAKQRDADRVARKAEAKKLRSEKRRAARKLKRSGAIVAGGQP